MTTLSELAKKAKKINVRQLALNNVRLNSELIAELNRQQLIVGENAKGQDIGRYISPGYAHLKRSIGSQAPIGIVDLKLTGKLHKKLGAKISNNRIKISSSVKYAIYQENRYGKDIFNLQDENWQEIEFKVLKSTINDYIKLTGL